jgi:hypothetical protein
MKKCSLRFTFSKAVNRHELRYKNKVLNTHHAQNLSEGDNMSDDNYEQKYTALDLRRQLKEEVLQSDKGGKPAQWS